MFNRQTVKRRAAVPVQMLEEDEEEEEEEEEVQVTNQRQLPYAGILKSSTSPKRPKITITKRVTPPSHSAESRLGTTMIYL